MTKSDKYENLVAATSAYFKKHPPEKQLAKEKEKDKQRRTPKVAYSLVVHLRNLRDCKALAKTLQRKLSSAEKTITYRARDNVRESDWVFVEARKKAKRKELSRSRKDRLRFKTWFYKRHWVSMPAFKNEEKKPYISLKFRFDTKKDIVDFVRKVQQRITVQTKSIWYPERETQDIASRLWLSSAKNVQPRYPVYVVSKGRAASRMTSRALERMNVPYFIAIEPQDFDAYASVIDEKKILVLPFSNHGNGPGPARNWCWDHSISLGAKRHWVLDDNIEAFYRLHENKRIRVGDGAIFRAAEDFVDRYENVPVAGFQYRFFISPDSNYPPFVKNTRIYSCLLIDNACKHRWRGRYNEDTILSLDVLSDGDCTVQFNAFLQGKAATQTLGGGNTAEFYDPEGVEEKAKATLKKSMMLKATYPKVTEIVERYGRYHHEVDYKPFIRNRLKPIDLEKLKKLRPVNEYGMKLVRTKKS